MAVRSDNPKRVTNSGACSIHDAIFKLIFVFGALARRRGCPKSTTQKDGARRQAPGDHRCQPIAVWFSATEVLADSDVSDL
jgi:hypothetical protein